MCLLYSLSKMEKEKEKENAGFNVQFKSGLNQVSLSHESDKQKR